MNVFKAFTWGLGREIGRATAKELLRDNEQEEIDKDLESKAKQREKAINKIQKECEKFTSFEYSSNTLETASKKALSMMLKLKSLMDKNDPTYMDVIEFDGERVYEGAGTFFMLVWCCEEVRVKFMEMYEFYTATGTDSTDFITENATSYDKFYECRALLDEWAIELEVSEEDYEPYND